MESYEAKDYSVMSTIFGEENKETPLGAVGAMVVLAIACCSRGILQAFLTQKWRVHVFLVLNFLLLSIFVISRRHYHGGSPQIDGDMEVVIIEEEEEEEKERVIEFEEPKGSEKNLDIEEVIISDEGIMCDGGPNKMSKDELNRRVEAFISMVRHQLVLDARNGGFQKFQGECPI